MRHCARHEFSGAVSGRVGGDGRADDDRRAQLWRAGGDDAEGRRAVCLPARVAGAAVGISLWLDAVSGDPDGNDCRGLRGVRQVPRRVFSRRFDARTGCGILRMCPPIPVGPMVLGNMEIGVSTANLAGIVVVFLLAVVNIFGVKLGALIQNVFTSAKALSLAGLVVLGFTVGRNATAWRRIWRGLEPVLEERGLEFAASGAGGRGRADGDGEPAGDSGGGAGGVAFLGGRVEQHHVYRGRGEESAAEYSAVAGAGHGVCADGVLSGVAGVHAGAADARRSARRDGAGARGAICGRGSRGHGGAGADLSIRAGRS